MPEREQSAQKSVSMPMTLMVEIEDEAKAEGKTFSEKVVEYIEAARSRRR